MDPWTKDGAPEGAGKITDLRARRSVIFPTSHPEVGDFPNLRPRCGQEGPLGPREPEKRIHGRKTASLRRLEAGVATRKPTGIRVGLGTSRIENRCSKLTGLRGPPSSSPRLDAAQKYCPRGSREGCPDPCRADSGTVVVVGRFGRRRRRGRRRRHHGHSWPFMAPIGPSLSSSSSLGGDDQDIPRRPRPNPAAGYDGGGARQAPALALGPEAAPAPAPAPEPEAPEPSSP